MGIFGQMNDSIITIELPIIPNKCAREMNDIKDDYFFLRTDVLHVSSQ